MQPIIPKVFRTRNPDYDRNLDEIYTTFRRLSAAIDFEDHKVSVDETDETAEGANYLTYKLIDGTGTTWSVDTTDDQRRMRVDVAPGLYDLWIWSYDVLPSGDKLLASHPCVRDFSWAAGATGARATAGVVGTGSTTITIKKTGVSVATIVFAGAASTGVITCTNAVSFTGGTDTVDFYGPTVADATLAQIAILMPGSR